MNAGVRLAVYGLGLVVAFGGAFGIADAVVPDGVVAGWVEGNQMNSHQEGNESTSAQIDVATASALKGLTLGIDGYVLSPVRAPAAVGELGELSFQIQDASGTPVTEYTTAHDKDLHLIVARSDGDQFRHVHPALDTSTRTVQVAGEFSPVTAQPTRLDEVAGFTVFLDGEVHTAEFVLDAAHSSRPAGATSGSHLKRH